MKESPLHLLRENEELRRRVAALEAALAHAKTSPGKTQASPLPRPDFIREIARMVAHDERYGGTSSLLVVSLEGLEKQKVLLGTLHAEIFHALSTVLIQNVRACDIVGHTGEEDFSILLTRCGIADAERKAEALATIIKAKLDPLLAAHEGFTLRYAVSILNTRG